MIPKVSRGDRACGLMAYLVGPGRSNEHTDPHLVAGDPAVMAWHDDNELSNDSAMRIGQHVDRHRKALGVEVKGGHVWHCSLSLPAVDGQLEDDQWRAITESFVDRMGFGDHDGTKAPMRWVAVRHGVSTNGNDHVHLMVNLVREDGTKASIHNDFVRAQKVCGELEKEHGLTVLESRDAGRSTRGYTRAEKEAHLRQEAKQGRTGDAARELPRRELARTVRACATASHDEAEFVRRLRREGVLVRPRFADGRTDVVTGFSVALRPTKGERPVWFGGGRLARDLGLPRLRQDWPDTPTAASAAAQEWTAAKRHRKPAAPGREQADVDPQQWRRAQSKLTAVREQLRAVPLDDRVEWARVARETSGVLAYWSRQVDGPQAKELGRAADTLAQSAQLHRAGPRPTRGYRRDVGAASLVLASALRGGQGAVGAAVLIRQLATLAKTVHDAHKAMGEANQAQRIALMQRQQLQAVAARLPEPPAEQVAKTKPSAEQVREPGPALPPRTPQTRQQAAQAGRGPEVER